MTEELLDEKVKRHVQEALDRAKQDWETLNRLRAATDAAAADMKRRLDVTYHQGQPLDLDDCMNRGAVERLAQQYADARCWLDAMICMAALLDMDRLVFKLHQQFPHGPFMDPHIGLLRSSEPKETEHDQWRHNFRNGEYLSRDE